MIVLSWSHLSPSRWFRTLPSKYPPRGNFSRWNSVAFLAVQSPATSERRFPPRIAFQGLRIWKMLHTGMQESSKRLRPYIPRRYHRTFRATEIKFRGNIGSIKQTKAAVPLEPTGQERFPSLVVYTRPNVKCPTS